MKLLFDQNLSPSLVRLLDDLYPQSIHVQTAGLDRAPDHEIWDFARDEGFVIVAKDEDFNQLTVIRGVPPKVIWIQLGNCTTAEVEAAIREEVDALRDFVADPTAGTFVLRRPNSN